MADEQNQAQDGFDELEDAPLNGAVVAADAAVDAARWTRDRAATGARVIGTGARALWRSVFD